MARREHLAAARRAAAPEARAGSARCRSRTASTCGYRSAIRARSPRRQTAAVHGSDPRQRRGDTGTREHDPQPWPPWPPRRLCRGTRRRRLRCPRSAASARSSRSARARTRPSARRRRHRHPAATSPCRRSRRCPPQPRRLRTRAPPRGWRARTSRRRRWCPMVIDPSSPDPGLEEATATSCSSTASSSEPAPEADRIRCGKPCLRFGPSDSRGGFGLAQVRRVEATHATEAAVPAVTPARTARPAPRAAGSAGPDTRRPRPSRRDDRGRARAVRCRGANRA